MVRVGNRTNGLLKKVPLELINKLLPLFGLKSISDTTLINPVVCTTRHNTIENVIKLLPEFKPYFIFNSRYNVYVKKVSFYKCANLLGKCILSYGFRLCKKLMSCNNVTAALKLNKFYMYYLESITNVYRIRNGNNAIAYFDVAAEPQEETETVVTN